MNIAETMQSLYKDYGELDGITIECQNELLVIGINNQAAKAEIALQGAQIASYQQHGKAPIVWLSDANEHKIGKPLRGGIPICWPWFNNINTNPESIKSQFTEEALAKLPAHGFVRNRDWQVKSIELISENLTVIELYYEVLAEQEPLWPFATLVSYKVEIGEELKATLSVKNNDSMPFTYSTALHTYFSVAHINQVKIKGFDNSHYIDTVDDWSENIQKGDILFDEELDRIYKSSPKEIILQDDERSISITSQNSNSTVVWNPWLDKAITLSHFNDNDYECMLCIETANILDDAVYLEADEEHQLSLRLK